MALRNYEGTITKTVTMHVSLSAHDWQLYSHMEGVEVAARDLSAVASEALSCGDPKVAVEMFRKARHKWAAFGAYDSEPGHEFGDLFLEAFGQDAYYKYC